MEEERVEREMRREERRQRGGKRRQEEKRRQRRDRGAFTHRLEIDVLKVLVYNHVQHRCLNATNSQKSVCEEQKKNSE